MEAIQPRIYAMERLRRLIERQYGDHSENVAHRHIRYEVFNHSDLEIHGRMMTHDSMRYWYPRHP